MNVSDLLLHPHTRAQLTAYLTRPAHAVGIIGSQGSGKATVARSIAREVLGCVNLDTYGYYRCFSPDSGSVTIEQAREIVSFTKLKTTGTHAIRRVIVITQAETMTIEAQNAVLKLIEEPPADTVIILTISSKQAVLPTILSRLQTITVSAPTLEATEQYYTQKGYTPAAIQKAYVMSSGTTGLLHALLHEDTEHVMVQHIEQAKVILRADTFERLAMIDDIVKTKQTTDTLYSLQQTAQSALAISAKSANQAAVQRWREVLAAVHDARTMLDKNAQPKLVLTSLLLNL